NMPHFYSAADLQLSLSVRGRVAAHYFAKIEYAVRLFHIAAKIDVDQVIILFICTANEVAHHRDITIRHERKLQADRSDIPWKATNARAYFFLACQSEIGQKGYLADLGLVEVMIAAQQQQVHLSTGDNGKRFYRLFDRKVQKPSHLLTCFFAGSFYFLHQ